MKTALERCLEILENFPEDTAAADVSTISSRMQGARISSRDVRAAAEELRLLGVREGENNEGVRQFLLQIAREIERH